MITIEDWALRETIAIKDVEISQLKDEIKRLEAEVERLKNGINEAMEHLAVNYDIDGYIMSESDAYIALEAALTQEDRK